MPRIDLPDGTRTSSTIFCVAAFGSEVIKLTTTIDTKLTAEPNAATQKMVDEVRVPSGKSILGRQH